MRAGVGVVVSCVLLAAGCVTAATGPLAAGADRIRIGKNDPEPGMREIGVIEAAHGNGCGGIGAEGTYEGAMVDLKNRAAQMQADYVQIFTMTEPHHSPGCYVNTFTIKATAFRAARVAIGAGGHPPRQGNSTQTVSAVGSPGAPASGAREDEIFGVFAGADANAMAKLGQRLEAERPPLVASLLGRMLAFLVQNKAEDPAVRMMRPMLFQTTAIVVGPRARPLLRSCLDDAGQYAQLCKDALGEIGEQSRDQRAE